MRRFCVLFFVTLSIVGNAKKKPDIKRADKYFSKKEYSKAITEYERLSRKEKDKPYVSLQLAKSYEKMNRTVEAAKYYSKAILTDQDVDSEVYYNYAQNVLKNGRYDVAEEAMRKFVQYADEKDLRVVDFLKNQKALNELNNLPQQYQFVESGVNDLYYDDYGLFKTKGDTVFFASNRSKYQSSFWRSLFEVKDKQTAKPNFDIYQAEFKNNKEPLYNVTHLQGRVNRRFNDGVVAMTPDKNRLFFASDSYRNRKFRKNKTVKKHSEMKSLFVAQRKGKQWTKIKVLPFCEPGVIYTNPSVSPDGKYLYFSSNREGSIGQLDIWRVALLEDNTYGKPEHLGNQVNRGGIDDYAFVSEDNILYFASDRWGGFGGLDIYHIPLNNLDTPAENLGAPINTVKDDFGFSFYPSLKMGFLSTNRIGRTDIYRVYALCHLPLTVKLTNKSFQIPIDGADVVLLDDKQTVLEKAVGNTSGIVQFSVECGKYYRVEVKHPDFVSKEVDFRANFVDEEQIVEVSLLPLEELRIKKGEIVLQDILFAFDKAELSAEGKIELDKLISVLKRYPTMKIKVGAHTDSKGSEAYNLKLSEARAKQTVDYLIEGGVDKDRLFFEGFGASHPKVNCTTCTEEEHAQNRRSEFLIVTE
ncbi:MAG: OmpA family protein [Flavobacteriaceae bacterium]|jgi:outer membrane protein OmpA-like peptidoglycan-associated protein/tetratricopeptide (TPR) repeat protein|nr:OmpA family protein [Flavobacteriaceae bacterium]